MHPTVSPARTRASFFNCAASPVESRPSQSFLMVSPCSYATSRAAPAVSPRESLHSLRSASVSRAVANNPSSRREARSPAPRQRSIAACPRSSTGGTPRPVGFGPRVCGAMEAVVQRLPRRRRRLRKRAAAARDRAGHHQRRHSPRQHVVAIEMRRPQPSPMRASTPSTPRHKSVRLARDAAAHLVRERAPRGSIRTTRRARPCSASTPRTAARLEDHPPPPE